MEGLVLLPADNLEEFIDNIPTAFRLRRRCNNQVLKSLQSTIFEDLNERFKGRTHSFPIIEKLHTRDNVGMVDDTEGILRVAQEYYENLYKNQQLLNNVELIDQYLEGFPKCLTLEKSDELEKDITLDELKLVLTRCSNQSAPGDDGAGYRLYKMLWEQVGPLLLSCANEIMNTGILPPYFAKVIISIIPKPDKDITFIQNYRPISLINCGSRIISGVLNDRLQESLEDIITAEQVGFMKGRHMDNHIQKFKYIYEDIISSENRHAHIWLLDFNKAFDRVSHTYLRRVLQKFNIGPRMSNILLLITTQQYAKIRINNYESGIIPLEQGTRQGNPVSPLLFNLCLEPFLYYLQQQLQGYALSYYPFSQNYKLLAYADDLTLFLDDSTNDTAIFWELLGKYEAVSNAHLNVDKTTRYCLGSQPTTGHFKCKDLNTDDLKYLGIQMKSFTWKEYTSMLIAGLWSQELMELPIHLRAAGFNTYIFSKLYFRDLHQAMTKSDVKYLTSQIKLLFFKGIGEDIVTSLNVQGGFGLLNLGKQLSGRRAQYVWHTLTNVTDWNFNIFRYKLQEFVNKLADSYQASTDSILAIPWYKFLTGLTLNYQGRDISTMVDESDIFTNTEKVYLEAWFDLIGSLRKTYTAQPSHFSHDEYRDFFGTPPSTILPPLFADLPGTFSIVVQRNLILKQSHVLSRRVGLIFMIWIPLIG